MSSAYYSLFIVFILFLVVPGNTQTIKGQSLKTHSIRLSKKTKSEQQKKARGSIGFLSIVTREKATNDLLEAFRIAASLDSSNTYWITLDEIGSSGNKLKDMDLIWFHYAGTNEKPVIPLKPRLVHLFNDWVNEGGKLLLSMQAVHWLNSLGIEPNPLKDSVKACFDEGYGRRLGFHAFRDHPLFSGLNGGAYLMRPQRDITVNICGFFGSENPARGRIVAVDWDYIFLREESKLVMEYDVGKGKVLAIGGYMNFTEPNLNKEHLVLFTKNALEWLDGKDFRNPAYYWNTGIAQVRACKKDQDTIPILLETPPSRKWPAQQDPLDIMNPKGGSNFWDVAGERLVTMGKECGGIEEVWVHPLMALRDYETGIRFYDNDSIIWLSMLVPEIRVSPGYFMRMYTYRDFKLLEIIVNDPDEPVGVVHYEMEGPGEVSLKIRFESNLRLMWPYPEQALGSLYHGWNRGVNAFMIHDGSGDFGMMLGANIPVVTLESHQGNGFIVQCTAEYLLKRNSPADIVFCATSQGINKLNEEYQRWIQNPYLVFLKSQEHVRDVLTDRLLISTPDPDFDKGYRWALLSADRFFVHTPGMGKALVAGYATTRRGWNGGQKVSGRPGYAWYFGRDGEWSGLALLDAGDFTKVRDNLNFYQRYQDLTGKIFHEASTSGFLHYDAADATPLYILLAGRYFLHTCDTAFLKHSWPYIRKAVQFCFSTDTDGDHLIENTNVGHGWVEGGELYGSHSTIYMAGSWAAALEVAAAMAKQVKDPEAIHFSAEVAIQKAIMNKDFWDPKGKFFAYGMNRDRHFRTEPTVLPSVPLLFGLVQPAKASPVLERWSSNRFSTNWGVRIIGDDSPWFKPTGYHYGSVWPLFTGWTSLAEYRYGHNVQGFSHLMANLRIYRNWGLGFVEEVMNGAAYEPSGVCPHQCWSETMVIQPAIEGLLGLQVNAPENAITLAPALPADWDSIWIENIFMADARIHFAFNRDEEGSQYRFNTSTYRKIKVTFMPDLLEGIEISKLLLNGKEYPFTTFKNPQGVKLFVEFELTDEVLLRLDHRHGISVLPVISDPAPGDSAAGLRIISAHLDGNQYRIHLEAPAGSIGLINVYIRDQAPVDVIGATLVGQGDNIYRYEVSFEETGSRYISKEVIIKLKSG